MDPKHGSVAHKLAANKYFSVLNCRGCVCVGGGGGGSNKQGMGVPEKYIKMAGVIK